MRLIERARQFWWSYASSWRKLPLGTIAVVLALLVLLSPEIAALGIDATFFEALVLIISAQLQLNFRPLRIGINTLVAAFFVQYAAIVINLQALCERVRA